MRKIVIKKPSIKNIIIILLIVLVLFGIYCFAGSEFREKGYVTEAVQAFITFFFEHYNESELMLTILEDNIPSWKIAEKVGFTLVEKKMYQDIDDEKEELYRFYALNR